MNLLEKMAADLFMDTEYINRVVNSSGNKYSYFVIKKKNGDPRKVYHPIVELKILQYWIVENIFSYCSVSEYSTAYDKNCSIKKNAEIHKESNFILNLDLRNFFESITEANIEQVLNDNNKLIPIKLEDYDKNLINKICLFKGHLVIGSICAPRISNCVMNKFDKAIMEYLNSIGSFKYSRYADDMTISSDKYIDISIIKEIRKICKLNGFLINDDKTRFASKKNRRQVTGLIIDRGSITVGLKRKREIKDKLYKFLEKNEGNGQEILGHLYFLKDIEPQYFNSLIIKYSSYGDILKLLKEKK